MLENTILSHSRWKCQFEVVRRWACPCLKLTIGEYDLAFSILLTLAFIDIWLANLAITNKKSSKPTKDANQISSCFGQSPVFSQGVLVGFEPAKVVMRVAVNFSRIAKRSSNLIWGADVDVVGTEVEVKEWELRSDVVSEVFEPAKMNLAASWMLSSG